MMVVWEVAAWVVVAWVVCKEIKKVKALTGDGYSDTAVRELDPVLQRAQCARLEDKYHCAHDAHYKSILRSCDGYKD